ncbi:hypothetical protein EV421DRAFT_1911540 [Armillaria borealis]|uniref:Uncharacterized protein n=1 Tax=Armillaria borealis TaxID=47425 RepID=A0AA39IY66_9AGAR|nr:hypothetical protein EV421DRAFT_1911540 [Armillaria borealis]
MDSEITGSATWAPRSPVSALAKSARHTLWLSFFGRNPTPLEANPGDDFGATLHLWRRTLEATLAQPYAPGGELWTSRRLSPTLRTRRRTLDATLAHLSQNPRTTHI